MIKALFFDIDGTLVSFNTHAIPPTTIKPSPLPKPKAFGFLSLRDAPQLSSTTFLPLQDRGLIDGYITMNGGYCFVGEEVIYKERDSCC